MSLKSTFFAAASMAAVCSLVAVQVYGFVDPSLRDAFLHDTDSTIKQIAELGESLKTPGAIDQIDDLIDSLDAALDSEPSNEEELMELRDALVQMRSNADEVADETPETTLSLVDGGVAAPSMSIAASPAVGGYSSACACRPTSSGGGSMFGSGGGISLGGGSGLLNPRRLLLIGGLVAGLASIDSDDDVAIQSMQP